MSNPGMSAEDSAKLGSKIIETALKLEESLAELIVLQVTQLRKYAKGQANLEISEVNAMLKHIIMTLILVDEKINNGLKLMGLDGP